MPQRPPESRSAYPPPPDTPISALPDPEEPPYETRPRFSHGEGVPLLDNAALARVFYEIGDLLDLQGELVFKGVAYRRAADAIAHAPDSVAEAFRAGRPPTLSGVGKAIRDKIAELADTGRLRYYERLRREVPPSLMELLEIPGLGPRGVRELHAQLGVETLEDLERAARSGRVRSVRGMGAGTEQRILEGIDNLGKQRTSRLRLGQAAEALGVVMQGLAGTPGIEALVPAGSFRRRRETIGDLDLLAATEEPAAVVDRLTGLSSVARVIGQGGAKAAVRMADGVQLDLMVMPPRQSGSYLVHFTGSAAHNVRLRGIARDRGWSLSEHGFVRLGEHGKALSGKALSGVAADRRTFEDEEGVYAFLDLPWIPPELREDEGEIEAAREGRLPVLVELRELQGDCHSHSDWTDGRYSIERMAEAARARGLAWLALTDHSQSLGIARGLKPDQVAEQREVVAGLNERFVREEAAGEAPEGARPHGFRILHGCEMEIRADGRLDYDDSLLERYDLVVASLHVGRRQPRRQLMERYKVALENPNVDIIAHPSGRKLGIRDPLDLDWEAFYGLAAETGTLLEVNGSDERLDLDPPRIRRALAAGCRFVIDSDAHYLHEFDNLAWGTAMARRGWLEAANVANTLPRAAFVDLLRTPKAERFARLAG